MHLELLAHLLSPNCLDQIPDDLPPRLRHCLTRKRPLQQRVEAQAQGERFGVAGGVGAPAPGAPP